VTVRADIETIAFGEGVLAHNRLTTALCALNGIGGFVLDERLANRTPQQIAADLADQFGISKSDVEQDVAALEAKWREANLIVDEQPTGFGEAESEPPVADFQCDLTITCNGAPVRLRCEEPVLAGLLEAVAAPASHPAGDSWTVVDVLYRDEVYSGWVDGRIKWSSSDRAMARHWTLRDAIAASLQAAPPAAILHASGISLGCDGVVVAALSGSGKTTLASGLIASGGKLISDDLLPLCGEGERLAPLPFALSVKSGSWPIVGDLFPALYDSAVFGNRNLQIRYFWPGETNVEKNPVPARLIVLPRWDPKAKAQTTALPANEAIELLIRTGTRLVASEGALAAFARFGESVPAYAITYPDLGAGIDLVKALLADMKHSDRPMARAPAIATASG
jgi:hypothetical protein